MGWVMAPAATFSAPAAPTLCSRRRPAMASKTTRPPRKTSRSPPPRRKPQPSIVEVQRAIGIADDPFHNSAGTSSSSSSFSSSSPFLDFVSSTPIGQPESLAESKVREAAEWMVDRTEAHEQSGQKILLLVCLKILPVWVLLLLVASGVMKLPFDLPFLNELIA